MEQVQHEANIVQDDAIVNHLHEPFYEHGKIPAKKSGGPRPAVQVYYCRGKSHYIANCQQCKVRKCMHKNRQKLSQQGHIHTNKSSSGIVDNR